MKKLNLTQIQVLEATLDSCESVLGGTAIFSRECGAIIDLTEAKEQIDSLSEVLINDLTFESLEENGVSYLELYL